VSKNAAASPSANEAEFDHYAKLGMPRSAAAGGFVDRVLKVEEMPAALVELAQLKSSLPSAHLAEANPMLGAS
jgi:chemotaxis response regulator CheB